MTALGDNRTIGRRRADERNWASQPATPRRRLNHDLPAVRRVSPSFRWLVAMVAATVLATPHGMAIVGALIEGLRTIAHLGGAA